MAKLEVSEVQKPPELIVTKFGMVIMSAIDPVCQYSNRSPQWGRPCKWVKYHSLWVFVCYFSTTTVNMKTKRYRIRDIKYLRFKSMPKTDYWSEYY